MPEYLKEEDFNQTELQKLLNSGELENDIDSFNTISFSTETTNQDSKLEKLYNAYSDRKTKGDSTHNLKLMYPTVVTDFAGDIASNPDEDVQLLDELENLEEEMDNMITSEQMLQAQIDELSNRLDTEISNTVKEKETAAENIFSSQRHYRITTNCSWRGKFSTRV